ncbi:hypothetical protein SDJN02_20505, partial [Cucurbita argyrosperma subsp. argyrosperma]
MLLQEIPQTHRRKHCLMVRNQHSQQEQRKQLELQGHTQHETGDPERRRARQIIPSSSIFTKIIQPGPRTMNGRLDPCSVHHDMIVDTNKKTEN